MPVRLNDYIVKQENCSCQSFELGCQIVTEFKEQVRPPLPHNRDKEIRIQLQRVKHKGDSEKRN